MCTSIINSIILPYLPYKSEVKTCPYYNKNTPVNLIEAIIKKRFSAQCVRQGRAITLALNEKPVRTPCYSQKSSTGPCVSK